MIRFLMGWTWLMLMATIAPGVCLAVEENTETPLVVVLPLADLSGVESALATVVPVIHSSLDDAGVRWLASAEIRPLLRSHRIRAVGHIGTEGARIVAEATGATHLLTGSIDIHRDLPTPEVAVSLRLVDPTTLTVMAATTVAASAADFIGLFGTGFIDSTAILARRVAADAMSDLLPLPTGPAKPVVNRCNSIALVPFDVGEGGDPRSGSVLVDFLLSRLSARGYLVLEPGVVNDLFYQQQIAPRGGIDLETLAALDRESGPCLVLTGTLDLFDVRGGDPRAPQPSVALGARVIDPTTGRILMSMEIDRNTSGSDFSFGAGRTNSLGRLTLSALDDLIDRIDRIRAKHAPEDPE